MNTSHENFIGTYSNVFEDGYCKHVIDSFETEVVRQNVGSDRRPEATRHRKDDYHFFNNIENILPSFNNLDVNSIFYDGLQRCYNEYISEYSILTNDKITGSTIKIQRTAPGQGYHVWHTEQCASYPSRVLVYILYLNTIKEDNAGETEFLYLQKRVRPVENTLIIWPAGFTHTHRGNPVFGKDNKYIITGWFHFNPA